MKDESSFGFDGEQIPCIPNYNEASIREEGKLTELYMALAKARSEFDEVVFTAPVGEVQGPVKTQFGYHLLEVTSLSD